MARAAVRAKTPWLISNVMNPIFKITGAFPVISMHGRRTGRLIRTPINVLEMDGVKYLVSPRGETGWSFNLRAVKQCSLREKGQERRYRASEVPPEQRGPMIAGYLERWGSQTKAQFDALPDPVDHPTFRLDPM